MSAVAGPENGCPGVQSVSGAQGSPETRLWFVCFYPMTTGTQGHCEIISGWSRAMIMKGGKSGCGQDGRIEGDVEAQKLPRSCEERALPGHMREPRVPWTSISISYLGKNPMVQSALRYPHAVSRHRGRTHTRPRWVAPQMRVSPDC